MNEFERMQLLSSARKLKEREETPEPFEDPYSDMMPDEKSKMIIELVAARERDAERIRRDEARIDELLSKVDELLSLQRAAMAAEKQLDDYKQLNSNLLSKITALEEQLKVRNKNLYVGKSQKGIHKKKRESEEDHTRDKDDFDGTPGSSLPQTGGAPAREEDVEAQSKEARLYRQGLSYRTMSADNTVCHDSDIRQLPAGAIIIKRFRKYAYEQVSRLVEHDYEVIRYKTSDGKIHEGYFPFIGQPEIIDVVPGTHASGSFLAYLAFNKYVLDTPLYREMYRLSDESMYLSRMSLTNWLEKGSAHFCGLIGYLKNTCLEKDSIVNCDETWCRVKREGCYKKKYIWCLVNRLSKVVVYCYEDGSRGRDALKHILGDSQVKALQSDGYNVYMYLDDHLVDIEHLCCMAHARAKFKYAFEQGDDKDAAFILELIGELYKLEREYEEGKLSPEQTKPCRNNLKTKEMIIKLRSKLDVLLSDGHPPRGELMDKAINYMNTFWTQLFAYLNDGSYSIDNSIAERFIRPLASERKNSLFFGSDRMARVSAVYHTIISTCKMQGVSVLDYFKRFFSEIVKGRRDYEHLLPLTIGLN
ncbi:IS66 family transposase [Bacteroides intestinalis]|uniref:IS66 family element, transposase n=1 Tax=Bacteroides intestinalis TaxID=329854 RepID=A0A139LI82_9BACE|nr:IS66 family transposase [Bacteroides intestinalis]KXT51160.1 IS66 family element, transposase [Bacteroides intestinalis]